MSSPTSLPVVTVTFSPGPHLTTFLDTLPTATAQPTRVVLADNGSTDGAPEAAAARYPNVTLLRTGGNLGYGRANNLAVASLPADHEFVVVVNPDVAWRPGALDELLAAAVRWPEAGAFGPLIREPDGTRYPSARRQPTLVTGTAHALLGLVWPANPWSRAYKAEAEALTERPVGWLSGSCLLLRRTAFDAIDGFDPGYFMYMEDVDLGDRLAKAGYPNIFVPTAEVVHTKGHAAGRNPGGMLPAHHRSAYKFQADRHPHWWQAPLRWSLRAGLALRQRIVVAAARRRVDDTDRASFPSNGDRL